MKDSEIYRKAARRVSAATSLPSCYALDEAAVNDHYRIAETYCALFMPTGWSKTQIWGMAWSDDRKERKACRIIALLLMSAIAQSEGR
jgi:TorA maturation chaperone TorD